MGEGLGGSYSNLFPADARHAYMNRSLDLDPLPPAPPAPLAPVALPAGVALPLHGT